MHLLVAISSITPGGLCASRKDLVYWGNQSSQSGALVHQDGGMGTDMETVKLSFYRAKVQLVFRVRVSTSWSRC